MEIVTHSELAECLDRLTQTFEALFAKLTPPANGKVQEYFSREEAAEYLRMGTTKLDRLTAAGAIRRAKLGDGEKAQVLYRRCDLDGYVETCLQMNEEQARQHIRTAT